MASLSPCATRPLLAVVPDVRRQKSCAIDGLRPPEKFQKTFVKLQKTFVKPLENQKLTICSGGIQHTCQTHRPDHQSDSRRSTSFPYGRACIGCRMWSKPVCRMPWRTAFALMFAFTLTDSSRRCSLRSCALFSKSCSEALLSCSLQPILILRMSAPTQPAQDSAIVNNV